MGLSNPTGGNRTPRPLIPMGPQPAICYGIIDLGTHTDMTPWGEKKAPKVMFLWEFPMLPEMVFDETKGSQRLGQIQEYTFYSDDKANLAKALKAWRGVQKIDLAKDLPAYLGKGCQLMIEQYPSKKDGEIKNRIMSGGSIIMPPAADYGQAKNPLVFFDTDNFSWDAFHKLYPFVQTKLRKCAEWNGLLQKHGAEPANPYANQQGNGHAQPVAPVYAQQIVQQPLATVPQPMVQQQAIPAAQAQVFAPTTVVDTQMPQSTGIVVGNSNTPPAF